MTGKLSLPSDGLEVGTNEFIVANTGKVGIGKAVPAVALDVVGAITATGNITANEFYGDGSNLTGVVATGIGAGAVGTTELADGGVSLVDMNTDSVNSAKIVDGSIAADDLASNAVTTIKIIDDAVTSAKILDNTIVAGNIANGTITTTQIATDTIVAGNLAADSVEASEIATGAVTSDEILDGTIATADIANDAVTSAKIDDETIVSADIFDGTIALADMAADSVNSAKIVDESITTDDIDDGTITKDDLNTTSIDTEYVNIAGATMTGNLALPANGLLVGTNDISVSGGNVGIGKALPTTKLDVVGGVAVTGTVTANAFSGDGSALNNVVASDIANDAVTSAKIDDETIVSADIFNGTIATVDLADSSVTSAKIANESIVSADILNGTITADDLGTDSVDNDEIATDAVRADEIQAGAVGTSEIADGTIALIDMGADSVNSAKIVDESIVSADIDDGTIVLNDMDLTDVDTRYVEVAGDTMTGSLTLPSNGLVVGTNQLTVAGTNVGVGTAAAAQKLTIDSGAATGVYSQFTTSDAGALATDGTLVGVDDSENAVINNQEATDLIISTSGSERMRVLAGGNVGIGKNNPSVALDVVGAITSSGNITASAFYGDGSNLTNVPATSIADNTITSAKISDGTITADDMGTDSVDNDEIATDAVRADEIQAGAVGTSEIADGSVALIDMANNSVDTDQLVADAVTSAKIENETIVSADILNGTIALIDMGADSVNSAKIVDESIVSADIDDGTIVLNDMDLTDVDTRYVEVAGDTMTGSLTLPSNGLVVGTNQLTVAGTNVGVGTAAAAQKLTIDSGAATGVYSQFTTSDAGALATDGTLVGVDDSENAVINNQEATDLIISTSGSERMRVLAGGNVGIGKNNPSVALDVVGAITASGTITANAFTGDGTNISNVTASDIDNDAVTSAKIDDETIVSADILNGTIATVDLADSSVTSAKIDDETIVSADIFNGTIATVDLADSSVTSAKIDDETIVSADIFNGTIATVDIADDAVTSAKIADNTIVAGNIATGAVETTEILDGTIAVGDLNTTSVDTTYVNKGGSTMTGTLNLPSNGLVVGTNQLIVTGGDVGIGTAAPSEKLEVAGNIQATAFFYTSDRRLKENFDRVEGLDMIRELNGYYFDWIETGDNEIGLIAQEVERVAPTLVKTNPKTGMKAVKYGNLVAPLIEAVKELDEKVRSNYVMLEDNHRAIASIQNDNNQQQSEIEELKARVEKLEKMNLKLLKLLEEK